MPSRATPGRLGALAALFLTALVPATAGEKTDLILLTNGDQVTGEIKKLDKGILSYKTDSMGTLSVELISDFFWELNFYYSFDSDPPSATGSPDDYGIVTAFGWSF